MDYKLKQERLSSLKSEVKDFHPLLKSLFPKLPNITQTSYTHGQNEMGADFVLHKHHATLDDVSYIGTIVKVGKIHQDFTDLYKQLEECQVPRLVDNGKRRIHLNEVWIITNESITNGAKEKIHTKYPATNIQFVDGQRISEWVDKYLPHYWYDIDVKVGKYLQSARTEADIYSKQLSLGPADSDIHIDLDVFKVEKKGYSTKSKQKKIILKDEIVYNKITVLEAGMGGGKSTMVRRLISELCEPANFNKHNIVPTYITYRELTGDFNTSLKSVLAKKFPTSEVDVNDSSITLLLAIDGLDEVLDSDNNEQLAKLMEFIEEVKKHENVKVLFATRPTTLLDEQSNLSRVSSLYKISSLRPNQLFKMVSDICKKTNVSSRIVDDLKRSDLFKQLPQSPMAALLLSRLLTENQRDLPSNITELYSKALELMLGRWDIQKGLGTQKEYEACERVCGTLANYLLDNNLDAISCSEAEGFFSSYLKDRHLDLNAASLFKKVADRSEIFIVNKESGVIAFRHRSFCEYFYAKNLMREKNVSIVEKAFNFYWSNSCFFYVGLQKDCPDLLNELLERPTSGEVEEWLKFFIMPNYFLAGYHSPFKIIDDNLHKLFILMATLYINIKNGATKLRLVHLPEMTALWFMQKIVRDAYAYGHFKPAIDSLNLRIADDLNSNQEEKVYALFFAAVVAADLGEKTPFDFLIRSFDQSQLPLSVSQAITCEAAALKIEEHSTLLKKRTASLRRHMKGNKGLTASIQTLFSTPISERTAKKQSEKAIKGPSK